MSVQKNRLYQIKQNENCKLKVKNCKKLIFLILKNMKRKNDFSKSNDLLNLLSHFSTFVNNLL